MGDLAKVHYVKRNSLGETIQDSKKTKLGNAQEFRVGYYEVSKCWDVAIMQMKSGEQGTITCPAEHDTSRGMHTGSYNNIDNDEEDLDRTSGTADVKYDIEIIECGGANYQPLPAKDVRDGQCMNIVSAWVKQNDQNMALMPGTDSQQFTMATWNKTDKHQKWQWNSKDRSLHQWIDVAEFEPSVKYADSYCANQGDIPDTHRADNQTASGPNGGEKKWHTLESCNQLCHTKTWCTEFTHWKKDNKGLCRLYGKDCERSSSDKKWNHYYRSIARPQQTAVTCPAEQEYFIEDRGQAITWAEAKQWVDAQPNGRLPTSAEVQQIIAKN